MARVAAKIASMGFFVLAAVGAASGVEPFDCAWRALVGAAVLFVVAALGGRLVVGVIASAVAGALARSSNVKDTSRERAK